MAGLPVAAVVAVALPKRMTERVAMGLRAGMARLADGHEFAIVGGDTNVWDGPLVVSITLLGRGDRPGPGPPVGGEAGGCGGRHRAARGEPARAPPPADHRGSPRPSPSTSRSDLHAMIDLSDGLAGDLRHILEESGGLGATLDAASIPIHPDAETLARIDGVPPLDHALGDGEDFELCFTLDPTPNSGP